MVIFCVADLHSTMYLLNLISQSRAGTRLIYLHSTMYLLNPYAKMARLPLDWNLHSTMYLLNRSTGRKGNNK